MHLIADGWLTGEWVEGVEPFSPLQLGDASLLDVSSLRPDFRGAVYQFLIGLLQTAYAPKDLTQWRERLHNPPSADELKAAFAPIAHAFELESEGPAFLQDLHLPDEVNQLPVQDLLIDAGSSSNLFFNKPSADHGLCEGCFAQALLTMQLNAPSGGRGIRTSLRGGGPLTTLLQPVDTTASLWQRLWLNVLPLDVLGFEPISTWSDVLPWLAPTRTSDDKGGKDTPPESVHPLQAYWSMPRRIRVDASTRDQGDCAVCGAQDVARIRHYRTRHGGTNYTDAWTHPLTPYSIDAKGAKPPLSIKGRQAGRGYRDWLGLVLGNEDHQPDAAQVVRHHTIHVRRPQTRLWCFGFDMSNMKALCWYDSSLPVHYVETDIQHFTRSVKQVLDSANDMAAALHRQVKAAWFRRPGDVGSEPAVNQSFWQGSEPLFYHLLDALSRLDFEDNKALLQPVYRRWLLDTRRLVLQLFDHWVLSAPLEDMDMRRAVKARADLAKDLNSGKALKPLWSLVNLYDKEEA